MTAKTPEELRMVVDVARALRAERQCECVEVPCPFCNWGREPVQHVCDGQINDHEVGCLHLARAVLSVADSAGWPQSLIDKARAQAIGECARFVKNYPDGPITNRAAREWFSVAIRALAASKGGRSE